ncbi:amidohydrolase family protein [Natrinema sp. 1APR25-10V2]|uniref:amidohydrolase family protein n=1 Tax=Natrinema sp. 1APR25-10V2 TaxID=2951081 RepID=UPI00287B8D48|nr:amidohydrolase family protein [Natrinema sp. 1APR25-10V2]
MTALSGTVAAEVTAAQEQESGPGDIQTETPLIDVHLHITPIDGTTRKAFSAEQAISWMDDNGVDQAILLPLESPTSWFFPVPTWWILNEASRFPDRFIPFCAVAPQAADQFGDDVIRERLRTYADMGARGIGELKAPLPFDDDRVQTVYEMGAELDLPILFHMDGVNLTDKVSLPRTEAMLHSYPEVDFIGHGAGWWSSISGDIESVAMVWPDGPVAPGGAVPRLLAENDNLYSDLSGGSGWNALTRDPAFGQAFLEEHVDSLIFGTDKLAPEQTVDQFALFQRFDLVPQEWEQIRNQNIQELL